MARRRAPRSLSIWLCAFGFACRDGHPNQSETEARPTPIPSPTPFASTPDANAPVSGYLEIGLAGAPIRMFGPDTAPTFAPAFASLKADGFDTFFPLFQVSEVDRIGSYTKHSLYFLASASDDPTMRCNGPYNPFAAARSEGLKILYPGFFFLTGPATQPIDTGATEKAQATFLRECFGGDSAARDATLSGYDNLDEPASAFVTTTTAEEHPDVPDDPTNDFVLGNVRALGASLRRHGGPHPLLVVEGSLPFVLEHVPGFDAFGEPHLQRMIREFWAATKETTSHSDVYGFDVYPVFEGMPSPPHLAAVGQYVEHAKDIAPHARHLSVLQGFGQVDLKSGSGRRPTRDETRFMAYDAVVHGARTVMWYGASAIEEASELWSAIRDTAQELKRLDPVLGLAPADPTFSDPSVRALGRWIKEGSRWVLVLVNEDGTQPRTVSAPLPRELRGSVQVQYFFDESPARDVSVHDGRWALSLPPFSVRVLSFHETP